MATASAKDRSCSRTSAVHRSPTSSSSSYGSAALPASPCAKYDPSGHAWYPDHAAAYPCSERAASKAPTHRRLDSKEVYDATNDQPQQFQLPKGARWVTPGCGPFPGPYQIKFSPDGREYQVSTKKVKDVPRPIPTLPRVSVLLPPDSRSSPPELSSMQAASDHHETIESARTLYPYWFGNPQLPILPLMVPPREPTQRASPTAESSQLAANHETAPLFQTAPLPPIQSRLGKCLMLGEFCPLWCVDQSSEHHRRQSV